MPDHVHILLQFPPDLAIAKAAMFLKGGSSRKLRQEFPELEGFLWGDSFWQDGYFAETVGRMNQAAIRTYIKNQKTERSASSHGL